MSAMNTIRWGIIGCGNVTEVKSGPGFQKARQSTLVAVMRRNGDLARDYAQRHGVSRWYDNGHTLIDDPEVDAIYIATPPSSHRHYTILVAQAGKPVYVEKPMALNYQECLEMMEACQSADVPLFVAYYRRTLPRFLKVKELIDSGAIGDVRLVRIRLTMPPRPEELVPDNLPWRVQPSIAGGGRFVDLASHQLDLLDYILGPIESVHGFAANQAGLYPAEDIVSASFVFQSGIHGTGTWCFTAYEELDVMEIVGVKGRITFSGFGAEDPVILTTRSGSEAFTIPHPPHVQQPLIQTVVDDLLGLDTCPSTGTSAARTSRIMDQILSRYYRHP